MMPLIVKLALRNVWRNKRRSLITFSALSVGIVLLIVLNSISLGFGNIAFQNIINFETGEIQIHASGYHDERELLPLEPALRAEPIMNAIRGLNEVAAATPRIKTFGRLHVGWEEFPVTIVGMDPTADRDVFSLADHVEGRLPQPGNAEGTIGSGLADLLDIRVGDYILLITRTRHDALQALDLEVVGIVHSPSPTVNEAHVYAPLDFVQAELSLDRDVTEVVLRTSEHHSLDEALDAVQQVLESTNIPLDIVPWRQSAEDLIHMMEVDAISNLMLTSIILVIALVGVTNTILLGALERKQEIGTMKAMGMKEREIVGLFLFEAGAIGAIAVMVGVALGAVINLYLVRVGIDFTDLLTGVDVGIPMAGRIYGVWNAAVIVWAALAALATSLIAGYFPARYGAKQDAAFMMRQ